jgi:hypothetical protein
MRKTAHSLRSYLHYGEIRYVNLLEIILERSKNVVLRAFAFFLSGDLLMSLYAAYCPCGGCRSRLLLNAAHVRCDVADDVLLEELGNRARIFGT